MPSVSKAQQHYMAGWEHNPDQMRGPKPKMTHQQFHDFAATPTRALPQRKMAMGGMVPPGMPRPMAQNRAIHASRPSMMPRPAMRPPAMPAPMPAPGAGYMGRYPAMAGGGMVGGPATGDSPDQQPALAAPHMQQPHATPEGPVFGGPPPTTINQDQPHATPEGPVFNAPAGGGVDPRYLTRYPMMASGGPVGPATYYQQGGEADVSQASHPQLPGTPSMDQNQTVGYAMGGDVAPEPQPQLNMPLGTDQQISPSGPERVKVKGPKAPMKSPKKPGRAERVAKFEKENGDRQV